MSEQENVELVKKVYADFNEGNIAAVLDAFAEDADWAVPSIEGAPHTGPRKGRAQIGEYFEALAGAEEILEFTQDDFIAQRNKVVVTGRYKVRIKATDRTVDSTYVHIFTISDRKLQQFVEYTDTAVIAGAYRQSAGAGV